MYFTIKHGYYDYNLGKYQENSEKERKEAESIINEFLEIQIDNSYSSCSIYYIDIKKSRKLKLLSLYDDEIKRKLIKLKILLSNEKLIELTLFNPATSGTYGFSGISDDKRDNIFSLFENEGIL